MLPFKVVKAWKDVQESSKKLCLMLASFKILLNSHLDNLGNKKNVKSTSNTKPTFVPKFNLFCYQVNNKKKSELIKISAFLSFPIYYLVKQKVADRQQEKIREDILHIELEELTQGPFFCCC